MATFEIQRNRVTPSGKVGQVPVSMNVDMGQGMISQALGEMGNVLTSISDKQQDAKNALKLSEMQLNYEKLGQETQKKLVGVTDQAEVEKITADYQKQVGSLKSGIPDVDGKFDIHVNQTITGYTGAFAETVHRNQIKNLNDQFEVQRPEYLQKGDVETYKSSMLDPLLKSGAITKAAYDAEVNGFGVNSTLVKTNRLIDLGDQTSLEQAQKNIDQIKADKSVSNKQLEYMSNTESSLLQAQGRLSKQNRVYQEEANKQLVDLQAKDSLTSNEVNKFRDVLSAEDYKLWMKASRTPNDLPKNFAEEVRLNNVVTDFSTGRITKQEANKALLESYSSGKGINGEQWATLSGQLESNAKQSYFHKTKDFSMQSTRRILGKQSGAVSYDSNGNISVDMTKVFGKEKEFDRRMELITQCNNEWKDWLSANPDATSIQVAEKSQSLTSTYVEAANSGKPPITKPATTTTRKPPVGQIVIKNGKKYQITGYDADGTPLGDEVK